MKYYPLFLDLRGQPCMVIGDGPLAAEKVAGLRAAGARTAHLASADYRPGVLAGHRLVFDASDDASINAAVWAEAEAAGILVNVVDRPQQCRFIAPAVVNRDPLLIAISTSGESPYLASAIRARLERLIGTEWAPFVTLVGRVRRRLRARGVPIADQTKVYQRLVGSSIRTQLAAGAAAEAEFAAAAIESRAGTPQPGRVALVGAGPGTAAHLSLAAVDQLAEADVVFHDALVDGDVLRMCGPHARLVDVGKRGGGHQVAQEDINHRVIEAARAGLDVVRLKGGDPFVFGRGGEELLALAEAGLEVLVVPGLSSATGAAALGGIPLTMRGVASSFAVVTARPGGPARVRELARVADTVVVMMGLAELPALVDELAPELGASWPVAVVAAAGTARQASLRSTLGAVVKDSRAAGLRAPATLVIGRVAAIDVAPARAAGAAAEGTR